ncbi:MAG: von Willebrand factor type A domain-containing protein [Ferruginibacter sp.]
MKKIILLLIPVLLIMQAFDGSNQFTITGHITDVNGNAIAFASVSSGRKAISSDAGGFYSIAVENKNAKLVFSAAGFEPKKIAINGVAVINVTLTAASGVLNEVVVSSAYGIKRQARIDGYSYNVGNALAGKVSCIIVSSGNKQLNDSEQNFNTEGYDHITENNFLKATDNPLSTFSIDVDAASYSNVRRILNSGQLPQAGAVRIEEMVNYFHYDYQQPGKDEPFSFTTEISDCPWNSNHRLALIGMQGKKIPVENLPASNLVFLIDVSGSMNDENKLPLVKSSLKLLTEQLREQDRVSIVVYAGAAGLVLPPTSGANKIKITDALDELSAGGSTAGGAGIMLAYKTANEQFMKEGNNRVILCTDGDFNVGMSSDDAMETLIEKERNSGVFLTVLGYGMGNYKDSKMQKLADKGNGNHAYIDGINEAKKVLVNEFGGTLFTIAKDVKLQVEFNPAKVQGYRLIGYENRMLQKEDFNDDKKDAGELGSGHTVTALYEIIPAGVKSSFLKDTDTLRYQEQTALSATSFGNEMMMIKFRFKTPEGSRSRLTQYPVADHHISLANTSDNFRFAAAVAELGLLLRASEFKSTANYEQLLSIAENAKGKDAEGYRAEFIQLAEKARSLSKITAIR